MRSTGEMLVVLTLAAPSCPWVSYQVHVFAGPTDPAPMFAPIQRNVAGQSEIRYRLRLAPQNPLPYVAATSGTVLLELNLAPLLPPLSLGITEIDREPNSGTVQAHPLVGSISFD